MSGPFAMNQLSKSQLIEALRTHVTEERAARIHELSHLRTNYVQMAIEDVQQDRNAGALIRTCDCFGVQQISVIEKRYNSTVANSISKGSDKWITVNRFDKPDTDNTVACLEHLKSKGFSIVATSPHQPTVTLPDFEITQPTVFLFGTETEGLSDTALEMADERLRIPIHGFTESFNISVSAALVLQSSISKLHKSELPWRLSEEERVDLEINWLLKSSGRAKREIAKKYGLQL